MSNILATATPHDDLGGIVVIAMLALAFGLGELLDYLRDAWRAYTYKPAQRVYDFEQDRWSA